MSRHRPLLASVCHSYVPGVPGAREELTRKRSATFGSNIATILDIDLIGAQGNAACNAIAECSC